MTPVFRGGLREPHEAIFFSFYGKNNALRAGKWKLVNRNFQEFELYDLSWDRTERENLAEKNQEKLNEMKSAFSKFALEVGESVKKKGNNNKSRSGQNKKERANIDNQKDKQPVQQ